MFYGCSNLVDIDLSSFNTSKVTDMTWLFKGCKSLKSINVSNFDTSKVTKMGGMFAGCNLLTNLNLTNFDTRDVYKRQLLVIYILLYIVVIQISYINYYL